MAFLEENGFLTIREDVVASASGDTTTGRKSFSHEDQDSHCHYPNGRVNKQDQYSCNYYDGIWEDASPKPFIESTVVASKTSTIINVTAVVDKDSTIHAVLVPISAAPPSSLQVVAGTDGRANAAVQTKSVLATASALLNISFTQLLAGEKYVIYVAAKDAQG